MRPRHVPLALASALASAMGIAACGGPAHVDPPPQPAAVTEGKALYDKYCALCHGEGGVGYAADNANMLVNKTFMESASDGFLFTAIARGRVGTAMGGYAKPLGGPLSPKEIRQVIAYLRSLGGGKTVDVEAVEVKGEAERAAKLFYEECSGCHGAKGEGRTALSLNNPLFLSSAPDGFIRHAIAKGRPGTVMPAFEGKLEAGRIDDLTALIRSWASTVPDAESGENLPTFERVVINPKGPDPAFPPLRKGRYVAADDVKKALEAGAKMVLLDARPIPDWIRSHIPGALPVPYYDRDKMTAALPKDTWIIAYCGCPHAASGRVMDGLREKGFKRTAVLDEGVYEWMQRGYPMTYGKRP